MTFNEFVEKNGLTPDNTPSSDHALLSAAYSAGYEEGKKNERELQCGKSNLLRDIENLKKGNTELKNAKCSAGKMTLDEAIEHLDETLANKKDWACESCKNEHIQLRKWLAELKSLEVKYNGLVEKYNALADRYNRQGQALKLELEENRALVIENKQLKEKLKGETMTVQNLEDVKIKDAFYFPNPGTQYKRLPEPFPGCEESKFKEECKEDCVVHKLVTHNTCIFCPACRKSPYLKDELLGKSDEEIEAIQQEVIQEAGEC